MKEIKNIAQYLDSTNLKDSATRKEINQLIDDAAKYGFAGICISTVWVSYARNRMDRLGIKDVKLITVPNWKQGGGLLQNSGIADMAFDLCDEIDYIWNCYEFADLKAWDKTKKELKEIRKLTKAKLKIIIEAYYIHKMDEKMYNIGLKNILKEACNLVNESGADWIKTDSGLFQRPDFQTLVEDCKWMVKYSKLPVKAAGGIRTRADAEQLIKMGVKRIGTSKAVDIVMSDL